MSDFRWEDVDWVELGCRGWAIEPEGAELEGGEEDGAHLDGATGHLMLYGYPAFVERVWLDLRAAKVPGYPPFWDYDRFSTATSSSVARTFVTRMAP